MESGLAIRSRPAPQGGVVSWKLTEVEEANPAREAGTKCNIDSLWR
jgi:hypothetical protein